MRHGLMVVTIAAGFMTAGLSLAVTTATAQAPAHTAPRTGDDKPDLNGIWQALNTAHWDIEPHAASPSVIRELGAIAAVPGGHGVVEGGEIPYRPEALAQRNENHANRLTLDPGDQVLSTRRAARHVHAVSVADHTEPATHHDSS